MDEDRIYLSDLQKFVANSQSKIKVPVIAVKIKLVLPSKQSEFETHTRAFFNHLKIFHDIILCRYDFKHYQLFMEIYNTAMRLPGTVLHFQEKPYIVSDPQDSYYALSIADMILYLTPKILEKRLKLLKAVTSDSTVVEEAKTARDNAIKEWETILALIDPFYIKTWHHLFDDQNVPHSPDYKLWVKN